MPLTGVYLKSTDNRPDDHFWWYDPENVSATQQTRDHLFKHCSRWQDQQAELWARVKEATKRAKRRWRVGDLLADERGMERWGWVRRRRGGGGLRISDPRARFSLLFLLLRAITVFAVLFMLLLSGGRGDGRQERRK